LTSSPPFLQRTRTDANCFTLIAVFPGLVESIDAQDYINAVKWADIIEVSIKNAQSTIEI
jgi:hypothetical protein